MKRGSCKAEDIKTGIPLPFVKKFPFMTSTSRELIVCSQYRYLTIVTDGGINPLANINSAGEREKLLCIEFDNGHTWEINEEIHNLNIERYGSLFFSNIKTTIDANAALSNGFHNLYLIFTMDKYTGFGMRKENPYASYTVNVAAATQVWSWFGINRPNSAYILRIPYIPTKYKSIGLALKSASTNFQISLYLYWTKIGENWAAITKTASSLSTNDCYGGSRFSLLEWNKDTPAYDIHIQITFLENNGII